jgi:hypothetical protein
MPWQADQFRAIMANTRDPNKRALYAAEQKNSNKVDPNKLSAAIGHFGGM